MENLNFDTAAMIALLKKLVESESPSHDKSAVDRVGQIVAEFAGSLGAQVSIEPRVETGDQVVARWGEGPDGILITSHMDTVFPVGTIDSMPFHRRDGKVFGPGVLDMKSGIVITLAAIGALIAAGQMPKRPVTALFTSDEEIGSHTSRELIETLARRSALVLVPEPAMPDGSLKTWRKGVGDFTIEVRGRAAHAGGNHPDGRNAIEELAHQVIAIQQMTDYDKGTTLNIGTIRGGIATNVVPDLAFAEIDLRVMDPSEASRIEDELKSLQPVLEGTRISVTGSLNRPPMPFDATMERTFARARAIAANAGMSLKAGGSGGGSDANFVAPLGIPVLDGLGASGEGLHSEREYIHESSLAERALLLALLIRDW